MTTATAQKYVTATTKAPTARGTFNGLIDTNPPEGDKDGERIDSYSNLPGTVPLLYQHTGGDPGAVIGEADVRPKGDNRHLLVSGRLDLSNPMAVAVHERMLLPADDAMALGELSVGFNYDTSAVTTDDNGVQVIVDAELVELSVVHMGAQVTSVSNVKDAHEKSAREYLSIIDALDVPADREDAYLRTQDADLLAQLDTTTDPVGALVLEVRREAAAERAAAEERQRAWEALQGTVPRG